MSFGAWKAESKAQCLVNRHRRSAATGVLLNSGVADLWAKRRQEAAKLVEPLALRMRPRTLEEFEGQEHVLGPGRLLRRMIEADTITSLILHGPPGTGKTTLAELIALRTRRHFVREHAAGVGVKRIREVVDQAAERLSLEGRRTILFLDEIHRFTRAQQDVLLPDVEKGLITLIGATTENPLFAVNAALVSRSTLIRLDPLGEEAVIRVLRRAIADKERGFGGLSLRVDDEALRVWAVKCDGDARRALTALEVAVLSTMRENGPKSGQDVPIVIGRQAAEDSIQQKAAVYDATGDEHYDVISAFIKSVRGSDPDAAIYWLARMLDAGEDPRFIARRLAILASEDIGNADPRGIMIAAACWELVERIGMPEARITLAQCTTYLALAPKSNASYMAIDEAMSDVREGRTMPVPMYIKDTNVRKAAGMSEGGEHGPGAGQQYVYAHDEPDAIGRQEYLGVDKSYYRPTDRGAEKLLADMLRR
ncbi:MAG TPA: replication-associated recombination protein A, partial [Dehalococcoidia bacterium]|nr:replication-associated recombination protein A [Dehalococcoidia bacterium]